MSCGRKMKSFYRRISLFLRILWRESPAGGRMSWKLSWEVASIMWGDK